MGSDNKEIINIFVLSVSLAVVRLDYCIPCNVFKREVGVYALIYLSG